MSDMHLSDVTTLRERARKNVENGAVTESYSADREEVLRLLNESLATEPAGGSKMIQEPSSWSWPPLAEVAFTAVSVSGRLRGLESFASRSATGSLSCRFNWQWTVSPPANGAELAKVSRAKLATSVRGAVAVKP